MLSAAATAKSFRFADFPLAILSAPLAASIIRVGTLASDWKFGCTIRCGDAAQPFPLTAELRITYSLSQWTSCCRHARTEIAVGDFYSPSRQLATRMTGNVLVG